MTKILPQEAAVIYAARHFITECGEIGIRDLPPQIRAPFACLEAACRVYDDTLEEPSEVVDVDYDPVRISYDYSDLTGLEPGLHVVQMTGPVEVEPGHFRIKVKHVPDPNNVETLK